MTFGRLYRGDAVALIAALALLLVMPMTWYTTKVGEDLRQESGQFLPQVNRELTPSPSKQAAEAAATQEKNAYRANGAVDRLLLVCLIAAAALAIGAAFLRASGRRFQTSVTPSALAAGAGLVACLLLAYRIVEPPGLHAAAVVKVGALLGLLCVGLLTIGARVGMLSEARDAKAAAQGSADAGPRDATTSSDPAAPADVA